MCRQKLTGWSIIVLPPPLQVSIYLSQNTNKKTSASSLLHRSQTSKHRDVLLPRALLSTSCRILAGVIRFGAARLGTAPEFLREALPTRARLFFLPLLLQRFLRLGRRRRDDRRPRLVVDVVIAIHERPADDAGATGALRRERRVRW